MSKQVIRRDAQKLYELAWVRFQHVARAHHFDSKHWQVNLAYQDLKRAIERLREANMS